MKRAYRYKIRPTVRQQRKLSQFFGCARFIYNWGLDRKVKAYKEEKKTVSYVDLAKELTLLKKTEDHKWLNDCASVCLQQSLRNLDNAYARFFKEHKGFPKFKSKHSHKDACKFIEGARFDFTTWRVKVPKIGWVKLCHNKSFDLSKIKLGTLTVTRDGCGEYWCVMVVEDGESVPPKAKVERSTAIGIDLGIKDFATLSDGVKISNPKHLETDARHLTRLQRVLSRRMRGSKRRERARLAVARLHRKVRNRRSDFLHKLTTSLIERYDTMCLEDLNVDGMIKNHHLAKAISSVAWSEFRRQLTYKAERYGKNVLFIDRFDPSSKTCSSCGYVKADLTLKNREWTCPQCGQHHDRDINAAVNIKEWGLNPQLRNKHPQASGEGDVEGRGCEPVEASRL